MEKSRTKKGHANKIIIVSVSSLDLPLMPSKNNNRHKVSLSITRCLTAKLHLAEEKEQTYRLTQLAGR